MKSNNKNNFHNFITDKIKNDKINSSNIPLTNRTNNLIKQINSHTNSNKNIGKFYKANSTKDKPNSKMTQIIHANNYNNYDNDNKKIMNFNINNSFLEKQNNNINSYNKFRKSKTTDKANNKVLIGYKHEQNNKNSKVIIKQNSGNLKNYNLNINKNSKYDNSVFNQVLKYYTIKSESKTLQIEDLSSYFSPIKNLLGMPNNIQTHNNTSNSINVNKNHEINKDDKYDCEEENSDEYIKFKDNINMDNNNEILYGKDNLFGTFNNFNNINNLNTNIVKNSVLNNNFVHSQRTNKFSSSPFNLQIEKISNINNKNKQININNNINNIKDTSEIDTQISTNNNHEQFQQEFNQFRTRKMSLPKGGINLNSIQLKNKILLNILHKRKQNK